MSSQIEPTTEWDSTTALPVVAVGPLTGGGNNNNNNLKK